MKNKLKDLAHTFLDTLFSDIDSLAIYSGIHSRYYDKYLRSLSKRFPFAIYYRVEKETALVHAVLDCRRSPAWIRKKLKKN